MELFFPPDEIPITNEVFQLYGEDLRCLDSGKPMMVACHYEGDMNETIETITRNGSVILQNPTNHPLLHRYKIRRIGPNTLMYDKSVQITDVLELTEETDIHKIFHSFDRSKHMYKVVASTKAKIVCIIFSHAIFDGVTAQYGAYTLFGKTTAEVEPIQHPPLLLRKFYAVETVVKLRDFLRESQLPPRTDVNFHTMTLKLADIKTTSKQNKISFPATACAMYLNRVFDGLPTSVKYLKVYVSVYIHNENRFNNYSVIPIVVYRDSCSPVAVHKLLDDNKTMVFGFYELFRTSILTNIKSQIDILKPDVIFSCMKNTADVGPMKLTKFLVYNYSSSAKIYACGLQSGPDNFFINSSIQVANLQL